MSTLAFGASALGCLWRERRYPAAAMAEVQRRRLRALLEHARARTRLQAERLAGLDLADPDLSRVAPVTKDELQARFTDSVVDGALGLDEARAFAADPARAGALARGRFVVATTSGTTGRVGYFVTDARAWAQLNGALFARILRHRLVPREIARFAFGRRYRMAMAVATEGHFISRLVSTFQPGPARAMMRMQAFSVMQPLPQLLADLDRYRPHYLHGYPTFLEALAWAKLEGRLGIDPEFVSLGSEPVSAMARALLARAFPGAEISETYGATECLPIANQCRLGHLHLNTDLCVLEPVDAGGRPVPPGVRSDKVYLTNLLNRGQPLIRYELGDSVTLLDAPCACGAGLPRLEVEGRSDDVFFLQADDGRYHAYPPVPFEVLFLDLPGLVQYQLLHERQNLLRVRVVVGAGASADDVARQLAERFRAHLARDGLADRVELLFEPVAEIPREAGGHKLRQIHSLVPRPGAGDRAPAGAGSERT